MNEVQADYILLECCYIVSQSGFDKMYEVKIKMKINEQGTQNVTEEAKKQLSTSQ